MTIRTVDPVCRICRRPLTDVVSRHRRVGPDCWARLSAAQQAKALALAAAERDPFQNPLTRPPSATARLNNANARRAVQPGEGQLCHHENVVGRCPECRREADPTRAAERILREIRAQPYPQRRADRLRDWTARRTTGIPAPPPHPDPEPQPEPRSRPRPRPVPARTAPHPAAEQLELI